jgi:ADP-dependent NAD(P)H-hydrate dehydratase / NAD(P)H-hydrate epimerase
MIKILSADQIKQWDAYSIEHEPIASIDLMERACQEFVQWFTSKFDARSKIGVVCGTGNNGGDGLGIARLLKEWNYPVKVWIVRGVANESDEFKKNLENLRGKVEINEIILSSDKRLFHDRDILIDAIFGSGLSRPVEGLYAQVIDCINQTNALRVAVDIPSGLLANAHSTGAIVKADYTISFQLPKLAFLLPQNQMYVGDWRTVDIGLNKNFLTEVDSSFFYLHKRPVRKILKLRRKFAHKGDYGKALLIAGSYGKMGACVLAARATLRAGIGLLTVHIPKEGYPIIQTAVPEAMALIDRHDYFFSDPQSTSDFDVIGIGPGIGKQKETVVAFQKILEAGKPLVIDADALNILAENRHLFHLIPSGSILTPHPMEFQRLTKTWSSEFDRLEGQKQMAQQLKSVVILKGANTSIATPDGKVYFNSTGNPGMATGGSGDVLTGILTGLLAQNYSATDAAILGVYLHGLSGDLAKSDKGENSLIASDLVDYLGAAFKFLER